MVRVWYNRLINRRLCSFGCMQGMFSWSGYLVLEEDLGAGGAPRPHRTW
jgi:hypothetical protein